MLDALINAQQRARQYADLGLDLPAEAAHALAVNAAARRGLDDDPLTGLDPAELTVENAADRLRDAALTNAIRKGMTELAGDVAHRLAAQAVHAFRLDVDHAIEKLRSRFLESAAVVTTAIDSGLTADTFIDPTKIITAGPAASAMYHTTKDAAAHLTTVRGFLTGYTTAGTMRVPNFATLTNQAHPDTLDQAEQLLNGPGADERWLALYAQPGITPALNNSTEAQQVVSQSMRLRAVVDKERKAAEVKAATERAGAWAAMAGLTPSSDR